MTTLLFPISKSLNKIVKQRNARKQEIFRRVVSIAGLILMSMLVSKMFAQSYYERKNVVFDPEKPTAAYVLGKLNEYLIVNAQNVDHIDNLDKRLSRLDSINGMPTPMAAKALAVLDQRISQLETNFELIKWGILAIGSGVASLLVKELIPKFFIKAI